MPPRKASTAQKKEVNPIVAEFQQCCKVVGFQDEDAITQVANFLNRSETQIRIVNTNLPSALCKALLRLFQRYQRLQQITLYSCPVQDEAAFFKQMANEFNKCPANSLALDYMPVQRESIIPLLSAPSLDILSLRGNQCLTSYDFLTHEKRPFPPSLNNFFNAIAASNIKVLNLYGCHLGDEGAIAFANTLFFNNSILCISLANNRIGDEGAKAIASALDEYILNEQETAIVEKFVNDESKQKISDEGGGLIKKGKGKKPPPKKAPASKTARGRAQQKGQQIERLLNFDPAAPVMPAVLAKWGSCVTLDNGQKTLPGNTSVTSLLLDENLITEKGAMALREMLMRNQKIIQFSISGNPEIPNTIAEAMARKLPEPVANNM